MSQKTKLRSGFTTGACAAAAAKAALSCLVSGKPVSEVDIPFPDGSRHTFKIKSCGPPSSDRHGMVKAASASVIKDAGDDPDVTNGAEISVQTRFIEPAGNSEALVLRAGHGVGTVTRPGLAVPPGKPAINPGPCRMIKEAVAEVPGRFPPESAGLEVTISVRDGELLAEKTLNRRLGIVGGISILGTTGIVRPVSAKAWTDTIEASMSVAKAAGLDRIVLSTGRTSERHVQEMLDFPEEGLVMMGDYLGYALRAANRHGFSHIHLAGMWAKILKAALEIPQTHVRNGMLEVEQATRLLERLGLASEEARKLENANTAREIYQRLKAQGHDHIIKAVCARAREYATKESGLSITVYLVTSDDGIVEISGP